MYGIHTMNRILLWVLFTCSLLQIFTFIGFLLVVAFCLSWGETHQCKVTRGHKTPPSQAPRAGQLLTGGVCVAGSPPRVSGLGGLLCAAEMMHFGVAGAQRAAPSSTATATDSSCTRVQRHQVAFSIGSRAVMAQTSPLCPLALPSWIDFRRRLKPRSQPHRRGFWGFPSFFTRAFRVTLTKTSCNITLKVTFCLLHQAM